MSAPVREGEILAGKYRVERVLGQGGMGVVVAARHVELDELVAVKFLLPDVLSMPEAVGRFLREARAAVRIKSEHVARVSDVGQLETGAPYMVMEYLHGQDLGAVLRERGPLPLEDALDYLTQACEAIAEAHALGIVHRDLKPSNLMMVRLSDGSDCIKLLDFGISKVAPVAGEQSLAMTQTASVLGSPLYMSPEQMMSSRDVDSRTDIWALGTILFELLTGQPPFVADNLPAQGVLIATAKQALIRTTRPDVPAAIDAIVARCLAKRRERRFPDVAELAGALAPFAPQRARISIDRAFRILNVGSGANSARPKGGPPSSPGHEGPQLRRTLTSIQLPGSGTALNWGNSSTATTGRRRIVAVAGALLAVAGLAAFLTLHHGASPVPVATSSPGASGAAPSIPPPAPPPAAVAATPVVPTGDSTPHETSGMEGVTPGPAVPAPSSSAPHRPTLLPHAPPLSASKPSPPAAEKKSAYDDM